LTQVKATNRGGSAYGGLIVDDVHDRCARAKRALEQSDSNPLMRTKGSAQCLVR